MVKMSYKQLRKHLANCDDPDILYDVLSTVIDILEDLEDRISELEQELEGRERK